MANAEAFPGHVIHDVQYTEPAATGELVVHEIQRPAGVGPRLHKDRCPCPRGLAPCPAFAHCQPFLAIEPVDPVEPRGLALTAQQDEQATVAKPPPLVG